MAVHSPGLDLFDIHIVFKEWCFEKESMYLRLAKWLKCIQKYSFLMEVIWLLRLVPQLRSNLQVLLWAASDL